MKKKPLVLDSTNCNFLRVVNDMIRPKSYRKPRREVLSWNSTTKVTTRYWEDIEEDDE